MAKFSPRQIEQSLETIVDFLRHYNLDYLLMGPVAVDLMRPRDAHDLACFRRKRRKRLGKRLWNLISPEDFVLQKLKVGRPRDFEDAVTVLEHLRKKLSFAYLKRWAKQLGILGELNYILAL